MYVYIYIYICTCGSVSKYMFTCTYICKYIYIRQCTNKKGSKKVDPPSFCSDVSASPDAPDYRQRKTE